jgi:hypothetical protein
VPNFEAEGYFGLAAVAIRSNNLAEAKSSLTACLRISPRAYNAYLLYGEIAEREHNLSNAREMYEAALRINPELTLAKTRLSVIQTTPSGPENPLAAPLRTDISKDAPSTAQATPAIAVDPKSQAVRVVAIQSRQVNQPSALAQPVFSWDLRLQRLEDSGSTSTIAVRMTGYSFVGSIISGDILVIPKDLPESGILSSVYNLTTDSTVNAGRSDSDYPVQLRVGDVLHSGIVSGCQERLESFKVPQGRSSTFIRNRILNFRIPRSGGEATSTRRSLQVEMVGIEFTGSISNGDVVEFKCTLREGTLARPTEVFNKTTGARVGITGDAHVIARHRQVVYRLVACVFLIVFFLVLATIVHGVGSMSSDTRPSVPITSPSPTQPGFCPAGYVKKTGPNGVTLCLKKK